MSPMLKRRLIPLVHTIHRAKELKMSDNELKKFHLYLVSDSTGETIGSIAKAVCAYLVNTHPVEHPYGLVRSERQLERVLTAINENPGPVFYSIVDEDLAKKLEQVCKKRNVPCMNVLKPFVELVASHLEVEVLGRPGLQHSLTKEYFSRVEALNFTVAHDDGQSQGDLNDADVILVGVSRSSKTPTCMYLANRGIKAANIPYVPAINLPAELMDATSPLIVGLATNPNRLVQIRKNRLLSLKEETETDYVDPAQVRDEVNEARRFFAKMGWPVIDVTRRSIEETSATILNLLQNRKATLSKRGAGGAKK